MVMHINKLFRSSYFNGLNKRHVEQLIEQFYYQEVLKLIVHKVNIGQGPQKQIAVQFQSSPSRTESQTLQEIAVYSPKCRVL